MGTPASSPIPSVGVAGREGVVDEVGFYQEKREAPRFVTVEHLDMIEERLIKYGVPYCKLASFAAKLRYTFEILDNLCDSIFGQSIYDFSHGIYIGLRLRPPIDALKTAQAPVLDIFPQAGGRSAAKELRQAETHAYPLSSRPQIATDGATEQRQALDI